MLRMSRLFGRTLREAPTGAELTSHKLAVRAGLVRFVGAGLYSYLPLGWRVARNIEAILHEEMARVGAQEMKMPVVHPAELWKATGRWDGVGPALMRVKDRGDREYALAMTHEEVVAQLARQEILSYRDLPRVVYHIQTKVRDEPRPRDGLLRVHEFRMKDAYSLYADVEGLDAFYPRIIEAYERIFDRCGLDPISVEADTGMMGGADSHEFMLPHPDGEDTFIHCESCDYAANAERAEFRLREVAPELLDEAVPLATPDCETIADVAEFVGVPTRKTMKVVFYTKDDGQLVLVIIRGDLEVNETKLRNVLGGATLEPASESAVRRVGAEPGYGSPVGLDVRASFDDTGVLVIADPSIQVGSNFVAGANRHGYHLVGVNYPRDFAVTAVRDIAQAEAGHRCPECEGKLVADSSIELGHCFKLGTHYAESVGATYLDPEGEEHPIVMGSYGIGVGRLMAAVIEMHHDDYGIVWPPSLAPFDVYLLTLGTDQESEQQALTFCTQLEDAGFEVLFDDREESAGVKFTDADLIGCPVRATVSRRSLEKGGVELKARWAQDLEVVASEGLVNAVEELRDGF